MKYKILNSLKFLNLIDPKGKLSITNIAVIIMVVKLAFLSSFSLPEVSAFLVTMLAYGHKRFVNNTLEQNETKEVAKVVKELEDLKSKVSAIDLKTGLRR